MTEYYRFLLFVFGKYNSAIAMEPKINHALWSPILVYLYLRNVFDFENEGDMGMAVHVEGIQTFKEPVS